MGFSLKKLLEGAAAQVNMNDGGKTFATVVRNQPVQSQPAKTPPPSYGSNPVKQAINRTRDVFDANTPQDRFKRQLAQKPVIDFTAQDRARQTVNGVKNVAGNYAKGFVESYNQVGTGLGTLLAQNSADVKNAQKAQNNLADQLHQQRMSAIKTAKNPNLNDVQRNRLNNYYNSLDKADVELQNSRTQQSNDLYSKLDPKKNLAAIGSVGFDIATLGVGTGGTQAVKQAFKSGIKTGAKELGGQMVKTGSLGAVSGGLSPIVQKGDQATAKDILQGAGMGFATGAALPAVAPAVKFGGSKAVNTIKGLTKENLGAISPKFGQSVAMATPDGQVIRGLDRFKLNQDGYARMPFGKDVAKGLSKEQTEFINDYANMLEEMGSGNGVYIDKNTGTRMTQNYRPPEFKGKTVTKEQWFEKARKEIESGRAGFGASEDYKLLPKAPKTEGVAPILDTLKQDGFMPVKNQSREVYAKSPDGNTQVSVRQLQDGTYKVAWNNKFKTTLGDNSIGNSKVFTSPEEALAEARARISKSDSTATPQATKTNSDYQPTPKDVEQSLNPLAVKERGGVSRVEPSARGGEYWNIKFNDGSEVMNTKIPRTTPLKTEGVVPDPLKVAEKRTNKGLKELSDIRKQYANDQEFFDKVILENQDAKGEIGDFARHIARRDATEGSIYNKNYLTEILDDELAPLNSRLDQSIAKSAQRDELAKTIRNFEKSTGQKGLYKKVSEAMRGMSEQEQIDFMGKALTDMRDKGLMAADYLNKQNGYTPTTPPVGKTVEQTPFGPVKAKTPAVNQTLEQPAISTNKTIQSQQRTKPLGVNENTGNDLNTSQKQLLKQKSQELVKSSYSDNTPNPVVKEYAKMLKEYDDSALGGELIPDGKNGYTRSTNHSPFYSGYFKMYGRKPSVKAWEEEALSQLQKGKADSEFQKAFNDFNNPEIQSLYNSNPGKALSPLDQNKLNAKQLRQEVIDFRKGLVPVKQTNKESKIPVLKVAKDGDVVTKTNVNPNIKKGEKRFSIGKDGELQEDTKGAYRLFTDDDGKVTSFRIGNKVYDAKDFGDLSQVNNYGSTIATMRRNIERAYKNNPTASDKIQRFIVDHQQHQATKMIERQVAFRDSMKKIADDLGISFSGNKGKAKKVSADIQNFGEGVLSKDDLVKKYGSEYAEKMVNADTWFRNQYDAVLNEMNSTLTKYGYDPIPRRSNYYTHFQDENVWKKFGIKMDEVRNLMNGQLQEANPTGVRGAIPSKLAGESEYLLPNKKFNPYALKREGGAFTPDAFQAFEKYLNPALNNIYMTPSITRTRVLAKAIAQNSDLAGTSPSKLIVQMREWANHLAGKTNRLGDRQAADSDWASTALKASEYVQRKVGQQSIVGNAATAVMQPVVLAQTSAKAGYKNTMLGIMQEFSSAHSKNAPIRQSEFMRRRYLDTTPVTAGKLDKASNVASTPLKVIEESAGRITWNSYYNQALEKGFKGKEAIRFADVNAEKTMAGRAIGEKPELYRSKTAGMATQFQLEVNNMWQQLGKEFSKKDIARFVVASYALNMGMQQIIGRQPSFNPLDAVIDSAEIAFDDEKSPQEKAKQIAQRVGGEVVGSAPILPQVIGLFMDDKQVKKFFGTQTPVGRFGVGSTFRSFGDNTIGKVMQGKPLEAGAYLATPFGYNQAQKTVKGIQAVNQGELKDENGQTTVQIPKTPLNYAKGALFGPSAIPEVNAYYSNIGVDKKDQKTVPNQTNSVASRQGNAPILTREDQLKDAKNSIKYGAGKEWQNLSEEDIKNKAIAGDQTAAGIYKSLQTMEKVYGAKNIPTPGLSAAAEDVLNQAKKITKEGQSAWGSRPTENKNAQKAISQLAGEELQVDNATAEKWAKYERDRVTGKINELDKVKAQRDILKSAYSSTLSADEKKYFSYNDTDLINALQNGSLKPDSLAKAMSVDAQLVSKGLITTSGFGKKVWNALGLAYPSVKGSSTRTSGRRTSGRRVSSKKLKTTKTISLDTFKKYKSKRSSTNSALRKLLGSAKV